MEGDELEPDDGAPLNRRSFVVPDPVDVVTWGACAAAVAALGDGIISILLRSGVTWRSAAVVSGGGFGIPTAACLLFVVLLLVTGPRSGGSEHPLQRYVIPLVIAGGVVCLLGDLAVAVAVSTVTNGRDHIALTTRASNVLGVAAAAVLSCSATWLAVRAWPRWSNGD